MMMNFAGAPRRGSQVNSHAVMHVIRSTGCDHELRRRRDVEPGSASVDQ